MKVYKTGKVHDTEVQFTMQLTYRTPMPGFEYHDANVEPISNYDGDLLEEMAWDEDCVWAEWHSVDDPIKGVYGTLVRDISREIYSTYMLYCCDLKVGSVM